MLGERVQFSIVGGIQALGMQTRGKRKLIRVTTNQHYLHGYHKYAQMHYGKNTLTPKLTIKLSEEKEAREGKIS